jgi:hypothetical protein
MSKQHTLKDHIEIPNQNNSYQPCQDVIKQKQLLGLHKKQIFVIDFSRLETCYFILFAISWPFGFNFSMPTTTLVASSR